MCSATLWQALSDVHEILRDYFDTVVVYFDEDAAEVYEPVLPQCTRAAAVKSEALWAEDPTQKKALV